MIKSDIYRMLFGTEMDLGKFLDKPFGKPIFPPFSAFFLYFNYRREKLYYQIVPIVEK